jgi:hypothetical protein
MRTRTLFLITVFFCTVSVAFGQQVRFDYDHNANFSNYHTFSWIKAPTTSKDPLMAQRITDSVNAQLMARGLRLVDSNGDLGVVVNVATQEKQTLNNFYDGFGGPWAWGGMGYGPTTVETFTQGTIVADLFDGHTKKVVWRASAVKDVSSRASKASEQAEKAIAKMFEHYPPAGS